MLANLVLFVLPSPSVSVWYILFVIMFHFVLKRFSHTKSPSPFQLQEVL